MVFVTAVVWKVEYVREDKASTVLRIIVIVDEEPILLVVVLEGLEAAGVAHAFACLQKFRLLVPVLLCWQRVALGAQGLVKLVGADLHRIIESVSAAFETHTLGSRHRVGECPVERGSQSVQSHHGSEYIRYSVAFALHNKRWFFGDRPQPISPALGSRTVLHFMFEVLMAFAIGVVVAF